MQKQMKIKMFLFLASLLAIIGFGVYFPRLTLPFGVAYIIYLIAKPLTRILKSANLYQRILYFCLLLLGLGFLSLPIMAAINNFGHDFAQISAQLPELKMLLQDKYFLFKIFIFESFGYKISIDPVSIVMKRFETGGSTIINQIPGFLSSILEWSLLVPMFLYFFFFQSSKLSSLFFQSIPNSIFEKTYVLLSQFNSKFSDYIIAKFIEATILGTIVTLGLLVIGFPYPFILGFIAGITNILPYIGPIIGFIPALITFGITKDPSIIFWPMFFIYVFANLIDMVVVFPLLVSKVVNLNPIIVVVSVIVGSDIGGVVGMIVIIPFIAFFKLLYEEVYKDLSIQI